MSESSDNSPLLPHGGYEKLRSYKVAEAVYDATVVFCDRFIEKRSRTHDQMVQAARSGVRNIREASPELAANAMLCAVNQAAYLLKRQLETQAREFTEKGGFTESLHATRSRARAAQGTSPDGPPCPLCGKATRRRTAGKGPRAGQAFWGCTAYPDCKGILDISSDSSDKSDPSDL
jgi:four helix bundle suffix protein